MPLSFWISLGTPQMQTFSEIVRASTSAVWAGKAFCNHEVKFIIQNSALSVWPHKQLSSTLWILWYLRDIVIKGFIYLKGRDRIRPMFETILMPIYLKGEVHIKYQWSWSVDPTYIWKCSKGHSAKKSTVLRISYGKLHTVCDKVCELMFKI